MDDRAEPTLRTERPRAWACALLLRQRFGHDAPQAARRLYNVAFLRLRPDTFEDIQLAEKMMRAGIW